MALESPSKQVRIPLRFLNLYSVAWKPSQGQTLLKGRGVSQFYKRIVLFQKNRNLDSLD